MVRFKQYGFGLGLEFNYCQLTLTLTLIVHGQFKGFFLKHRKIFHGQKLSMKCTFSM